MAERSEVGSELVFKNGEFGLGVRSANCDCGDPQCPVRGKVTEVTSLVAPVAAARVCERYLAEGRGSPLAFPMFLSAIEAREMAAKLIAFADAAATKSPS